MVYTGATEEMARPVNDMVERMMKTNKSFTCGWDVVVSYSEQKINDLLAKRHEKGAATMLKDITITYEEYDSRAEEDYNVTTTFRLGPPKLQFNARATEPACSLLMKIVSGSVLIQGQSAAKPIPEGYTMEIKNLPLMAVRGSLVDGKVQVSSDSQGPSKILKFDDGKTQDGHVVLDFRNIQDANIKVDHRNPDELKKGYFAAGKFKDGLVKFMNDRNKVDGLSYSIASVNNATASSGFTVLTPESFMFASFTKGLPLSDPNRGANDPPPVQTLSLFIKTRGGFDSGIKENLTASWVAQWNELGLTPIPGQFTASLLFSKDYVYKIMFAPVFSSGLWSSYQLDSSHGLSLKATSSDKWYIGSYDFDYGPASHANIDSCYVNTPDWPFYLQFKHDSARDSPSAYMKWNVEATTTYVTTARGILDWIKGGSGNITYKWRLAHLTNTDDLQRIRTKVILNDTEFQIEVDPSDMEWRTDVVLTKDSWIDVPPYQNAVERIRDAGADRLQNPTFKFPGIHYLRTTNLLTPDREVIDFNEGIGMKFPRDMMLVGTVIPG